ncbi:MAG: 50S ribosomal protein L4 [Bacteroidales bacterium]|jgi:large subunit ribosomal protein L4|nr:50S ribosomal protein L4 [Bacteroidales bacterium]MBP8677737.1 50S ribosomal protein L4 [Bacteroidales bacterium]MBP9584138.1 50S ribosomal protein L4 [Bacteroidales bacterium]MBP9977792.1 50S ribosomal protein L4 [Bacteroidales bacterium]
MELSVYKTDGSESGKKVTLDSGIFGIEPNDHAIYLDVKQYLANQRQGTHKTKEKWEVAYSTKKIVRQKGSGGARHGSIKSPTFVGGGRAFGPQPRDYSFKLNKKLKQLARFSALSYKVKESALTIVESFDLEAPKTKEMIRIVKNLKVNDRKILFVLPENSENIYMSSRNLQNVKVITVNEISTYDLVNSTSVVFIDGVQDILQAQYGRK